MYRSFPSLHINLPEWVSPWVERQDHAAFDSIEGRMRFAIGLSRENINAGTGGPFGAALFNGETHELVAPGMNLVTSLQCSVLHAEIVAIMLAQKIVGSFDLGKSGLPPLELVTSIAPCAMCLGAIPWSGVKRLVCGGRDEDARSIGFDEGAKVDTWRGELHKRGIETVVDICREEAIDVLRSYAVNGGAIYNSSRE
jgi:tRNA(Arg) A34 adenosine deaminase TadA